MTIRKIFPVSFTTTYGIPEIETYLEECENDGIEPTQENFLAWAKADFRYLAENSALTECNFVTKVLHESPVLTEVDVVDEPKSSWFSKWVNWATNK